jgi:TatA/E family protein of Tat protein translocase
MGPLGYPEMVFIFFLALILFGPKKLPELGRTVGKALTEFRRASNELKSTFDREMKSLEQETESFREVANQYQSETYSYDYQSYESTYEGAYGSETYETSATTPSTISVSATQDAELPAAHPEGTIAHGTEAAVAHDTGGHPSATEPAGSAHPAPASPAEHNS